MEISAISGPAWSDIGLDPDFDIRVVTSGRVVYSRRARLGSTDQIWEPDLSENLSPGNAPVFVWPCEPRAGGTFDVVITHPPTGAVWNLPGAIEVPPNACERERFNVEYDWWAWLESGEAVVPLTLVGSQYRGFTYRVCWRGPQRGCRSGRQRSGAYWDKEVNLQLHRIGLYRIVVTFNGKRQARLRVRVRRLRQSTDDRPTRQIDATDEQSPLLTTAEARQESRMQAQITARARSGDVLAVGPCDRLSRSIVNCTVRWSEYGDSVMTVWEATAQAEKSATGEISGGIFGRRRVN